MNNIILSILTPTIPERLDKWIALTQEIHLQVTALHTTHPSLGHVQHLSDTGDSYNAGGLSIGKKREKLVQQAEGKYLCFLDDDDWPAPNYVETLARHCNLNADVVTFRNFTTTDFFWTLVDMSLNNPTDEEATPDRIVKRRPWLVCPVRSKYAKQFAFPDINYSEDSIWMNQVLTLCRTEAHTDKILHSYRHSAKTSEADRIIRTTYDRLL